MKQTCLEAISFLPTTAVLELTYKCNHACIFCSCPWFAPDDKFKVLPELTTKQWKEAIAKISAMGVKNISFSGGEALLREDFWEIADFAAKLNDKKVVSKNNLPAYENAPIDLYLISNGKILDDKTLDLIKKYKINLSISLPGLENYESMTGGKGDVQKALDSIYAAKNKGLFITCGITVTKKNLNELYKNIAAAFLTGAGQLLLNIFLKGGCGLKHAGGLSLSKEEIITALDTAEKVLCEAGRNGSLGTEVPKCLIETKKYSRLNVAHRCSAAKGFFVIDPSGYLRVCNHSQTRLNHYTDIDSLKTNKYWLDFALSRYIPQACLFCPEISSCDGGCREEANILHSSINAENDYVREVQNERR